VLDLLGQKDVSATFFVIGNQIRNQDVLRRMTADGHVVANHTYSHPVGDLNLLQVYREVETLARQLLEAQVPPVPLFRPPGGVLDNGLVDYARLRGFVVIMWTFDTYDWREEETAEELAAAVLDQAEPGGIVLLHDGGAKRETLVEALPLIINGLRGDGYELVTVPELLQRAVPAS
jgi:chitin deacetylase